MEEISLHLLDIAENSLRAGATKIEIMIQDSPEKNYLFLKIRDNGRGMDSEEINKLVDPFYTTRTERNIGLGIPLLKMTADNCNGSLLISSVLGKGTTIEVTLEHNNIDRPPLGNIAATIITLLVGWPYINLYYKHFYLPQKYTQEDVNSKGDSFIFETEEVKKRIDNVPIDNPKVIKFLGKYLRDNLNKIYGGENNEVFG